MENSRKTVPVIERMCLLKYELWYAFIMSLFQNLFMLNIKRKNNYLWLELNGVRKLTDVDQDPQFTLNWVYRGAQQNTDK